jgi:hypothetical protein
MQPGLLHPSFFLVKHVLIDLTSILSTILYKQLPGPKLWAATRFRYILSVWSGWLHTDVKELHRQFGDRVRITPDETSFARANAHDAIYFNAPARPAFPKSKLWYGAAPERPLSILNASGPRVRAKFRKAMTSSLTEKALRPQVSVVQKHVVVFIVQLEKLSSNNSDGVVVNIVQWFAFVAFDLLGDLGFGEPFGCFENAVLHP